MKGFKAFNKDLTCRGKQYKIGEVFEEDVNLKPCVRGMHFCTCLPNVFQYYDIDPDRTVVAEVEALGDVKTDDGIKFCTNKLYIIRKVLWDEVQKSCNIGNHNAGNCNIGNHNAGNYNIGNHNAGNYNIGNHNTGNWNTGDYNAGDYNTGNFNARDYNTGNWNTGDYNTGDYNTGNCNAGDYNIGNCNAGDYSDGNHNTGNHNAGDYNTGDCNTGNWNTGDWNRTFASSGCFNTEEKHIIMFNKPSVWTIRDWLISDARVYLNRMTRDIVKWVYSLDMTDEEKAEHPEYGITGGYLKILDKNRYAQEWWDGADEKVHKAIKSLPNFDPAIFEECTGINVESREESFPVSSGNAE